MCLPIVIVAESLTEEKERGERKRLYYEKERARCRKPQSEFQPFNITPRPDRRRPYSSALPSLDFYESMDREELAVRSNQHMDFDFGRWA